MVRGSENGSRWCRRRTVFVDNDEGCAKELVSGGTIGGDGFSKDAVEFLHGELEGVDEQRFWFYDMAVDCELL